jgi:plastocyanin
MKRRSIGLATVLAAAASLALPATAATTVSVGDNYFVRSTGVPIVSVAKGSRVTFRWVGHRLHNAHGVGISTGLTCNRTRTTGSCVTPILSRTGTFTVYCQVHGAADMSMKLRVS